MFSDDKHQREVPTKAIQPPGSSMAAAILSSVLSEKGKKTVLPSSQAVSGSTKQRSFWVEGPRISTVKSDSSHWKFTQPKQIQPPESARGHRSYDHPTFRTLVGTTLKEKIINGSRSNSPTANFQACRQASPLSPTLAGIHAARFVNFVPLAPTSQPNDIPEKPASELLLLSKARR